VCSFLVEDLTLLYSLLFVLIFGYSFSLILCSPFVLFRQKGGVFFVLDRECISKPVKCFLSQNGQRGSLIVFYIGYILDDKNTLCNGCYLNRIIGLIQNLQVIWTLFISSHVPCHKFLENVHEDSMQIPSQLAGSCATVWTGL
jgi:hypothetical protein